MNLTTAKQTIYSWPTRLTHSMQPTTASQTAVSTGIAGHVGETIDRVRVRLGGQKATVRVRRGTTDLDLVRMVLQRNSVYRLPDTVQPNVIFDIGANIGTAAIYFALTYPQAKIYCFEPLPENLELLLQNTQPWSDRVHVVPYGLSDKNGKFEYFMSDNPRSFGGGGFHPIGHDPSRRLILPLASVQQALAGLGVDHIDVFKIDTEGSELAILRSIPESIRAEAQAYIGELHGIGDWQVCSLLEKTHAVGIQKRFDRRCFPFLAVRRDLVD